MCSAQPASAPASSPASTLPRLPLSLPLHPPAPLPRLPLSAPLSARACPAAAAPWAPRRPRSLFVTVLLGRPAPGLSQADVVLGLSILAFLSNAGGVGLFWGGGAVHRGAAAASLQASAVATLE